MLALVTLTLLLVVSVQSPRRIHRHVGGGANTFQVVQRQLAPSPPPLFSGLLINPPKPSWQSVVLSYHDWDGPLMLRVAMCESTDRPGATDPVVVTLSNGRMLHAQGVLQVLGGSFDADANVREAHALWLKQGYRAWKASEGCWG